MQHTKIISASTVQNSPFFYFVLSILFCLPVKSTGQDIKKIKESDTLYVYFKYDNLNQMKESNNIVNRDNYNYSFVFVADNTKIRHDLTLVNNYKITPEVKFVKHSFLRKRKDITVNYNFLKTLGFRESEKLLLEKKKIYLIDYEYLSHHKVRLAEVKMVDRSSLISIE